MAVQKHLSSPQRSSSGRRPWDLTDTSIEKFTCPCKYHFIPISRFMIQTIFIWILGGTLLCCLIHLEALGPKKMASFSFLSSVCEIITSKSISLTTRFCLQVPLRNLPSDGDLFRAGRGNASTRRMTRPEAPRWTFGDHCLRESSLQEAVI